VIKPHYLTQEKMEPRIQCLLEEKEIRRTALS